MKQKEIKINRGIAINREVQTGRCLLHRREARRECSQCLDKWLIAICFAWMIIAPVQANETPFSKNETWNYIIRYKYGLVVMKAGSGLYQLQKANYKGEPAIKSSLNFKTNSFFDKLLMVRDTLTAYATLPDFIPLYQHRVLNEGNTHFTDEMWTQKFGKDYTEMRVKRIQEGEVRMDTIITASNAGYDFVNVFLYFRQLDYSSLNPGDKLYITTFMGNKKTNFIIRYVKPTLLERSNKQQNNAFHLAIDISNEVFSEAKSAMEVWISDDEYQIPLKIRAKLKIGAVEIELM